VAGGSTGVTCRIWDVASGRPVSPLLPHINWVRALAFSPDGQVLATGDYSGAVHLWDVATGARRCPPRDAGSAVLCLAFSPDGRRLAAGTANPANHVLQWDLQAGGPPAEPIRLGNWFTRLAFGPDGRRLAAASNDHTVRLIDAATSREVTPRPELASSVHGLAFSPDGRWLLATDDGGSGTGQARLWDAETGRPASPLLKHPAAIAAHAMAFSPDGTFIAIGCQDGSVLVWDVATGRPLGLSQRLRNPILGVAFGRDGRTLRAVDDRGWVANWPLPEPRDEPVGRLVRRVQVRTGLRLGAADEAEVLDPATWQSLRAEIGEDAPSAGEPTDELAWHEASARDAEALGQSFAAAWHLDRLLAARADERLLHARRAAAALSGGDVAAARAGFARAVELGPRDRILDWLLHRAEDFRADGRPEDSLVLLDRVIAGRPEDWLTYAARAEVLAGLGRDADREADLSRAVERGADIPFLTGLAAERSRAGRWAEAVALYDRAIAMGTVPYEVWTQAAVAHLEIGDEAGYRRACKVLRERHPAGSAEINVQMALAIVLALGPGGVDGDGQARVWSEPLEKRRVLGASGALLYRSGHHAEAIGLVREVVATTDRQKAFEENLFLAMASFRAGDRAKARVLLKELGPEPHDRPSSEDWWRAQSCRLLRREAVRLIFDGEFPTDPFAP
jgi:tetratricopeptide (TPR) repeat protein/DNA-binding beta-propeller fold protein YncE